MGAAKLTEAIHSKSLSAITKAFRDLANEADFQLKPPYTELKEFKARQDGDRFEVQFAATLSLHYSRPSKLREGFVLVIEFNGSAYSDSPGPPLHELFYAAVVQCFRVFGYGPRWRGKTIPTPVNFTKNLEVDSPDLV